MKKGLFFLSSLLVFAMFNVSIWQKEQIKRNGETVLLQLAPVDPRSLIQGDYMRLRFAIESSARSNNEDIQKGKQGYAVISVAHNRVAKFERFYRDEPLTPNEKLLHYSRSPYDDIHIVPDSFMFQEGQASLYERAKYGVFKFDRAGNYILVGLADEGYQTIEPPLE